MPHPRTSQEVKEIIGSRTVLMPTNTRSRWYSSRLVVLEDGSTMPLLWFLYEHKYGAWDPSSGTPYWKDGDWSNEDLTNVAFAPTSEPRQHRSSKYGVPSGTRQYHRLYARDHAAERKAYQKTYYKRMREAYHAQLSLVAGEKPPARSINLSPDALEELARKLTDLDPAITINEEGEKE